MAHARFFVVLHKGQWKISFNGYFYGPYNFKPEAIGVAVKSAHERGKLGDEAEVLVQGWDRKVHTEWSYGRDPYPPKGLHISQGVRRPTPLANIGWSEGGP